MTGFSSVRGNEVSVTFDEDSTSIHASTCGKSLCLPLKVEQLDQNTFSQAMLSIISLKGFTMP